VSTLVDRNGKILVHSFTNSRIGAVFNPNGIVDEVINNNRRILVTTTMTKAEFALEQSSAFADSSLNPLLTSTNLMPSFSSNTIVVRFACAPVYASNNTAQTTPDAVLIAGDIVNGKVGLNELVLSTFGDGFSGYYYYDEGSDKFQYISGVYRASDGSYDYNPSDLGHHELLRTALYSETSVFDQGIEYGDDSYEVAVARVKSSAFVDCTGTQLPLTDDSFNPPVFHVRAVSGSRWSDLRKSQLAVQIITVLFQLIALIGISYVLYVPIKNFAAQLGANFKGATSSSQSKWQLDCLSFCVLPGTTAKATGSSTAASKY